MNAGAVPRFELAAVHEAATDGRVEAGGPRYRERLLPLLGEFTKMHAFACAVLLELKANDFIETERYPKRPEMDAYGVAISQDIQERFGLEGFVTWYVKFTMDTGEDGRLVLMASLHGAEYPLKRIGGTLPVEFSRREP